ncbi:hypothetical protein [Oceanisphaera avium]|uniref:Uncharacterized protein n=1 Tax=Oceanisphaera avium TaxID=1903694 RepID=A0A1Y0CXL1_9GAMM|nr:hypothetical protein [Oceanisphaera avium]ART79647.1 hypothetical protein CBP12_05340 [Oceanisphaera avium]
MDSRKVGQVLILLSSVSSASYGFEESVQTNSHLSEPARSVSSPPADTPALSRPAFWSFTPKSLTFTHSNLLTRLSDRYQLNLEFSPSEVNAKPNFNAYPSYQLSSQSSLGFSFNHFRPRFNFERAGLQTSLHFRGDGVKLNFRPTAISKQLEFDVKISDDESRLDLTYRY